GGIDPRNGVAGPGFITSQCLFNPSRLQFEWKVDTENRKVPYLIFGKEKYRINNLHIHSKNLKLFLS
ncbi:MAG: hypothetical protein U1E02_10985, partial [Hydrogenophaga sp.]|nr:hypothetical protein [Hydrogenophaga sp.]